MAAQRHLPAAVALSALILLAGCGEDIKPLSPSISTPEEPVPLPEGEEEIYDGFEELSELTIPEDAEDVEITVNHSGANLPVYYATFITDPDGVEEFCNTENFSPYRSNSPPDEEQRERFDITEDTVDGMVRCTGGGMEHYTHREVIVVWPEEDVASVYAIVEEWPPD